jgi:hypothetical protein
MAQKHTPTPWRLGPFHKKDGSVAIHAKGESVFHMAPFASSEERAEANAAFIVKAVNAHEGLVKALERAITYIELTCDEEAGEEAAEAKHDLDMARAALKAADAAGGENG